MKEGPIPAPGGKFQREYKQDGKTVLSVRARWPRQLGESRGARQVERYYEALAERWLRRWSGPLLTQAREGCTGDSPPWRAELDYALTLDSGELLSFRLDAMEDRGGRRRQVRMGDVWRMPAGEPLSLPDLLPRRRWWRSLVLPEVRRQIGAAVQAGESLYYDGWESLCSRWLSPDRAYLTAEGPVVFYPMETIAPALEGFPTFSLAALLPKEALPAEG